MNPSEAIGNFEQPVLPIGNLLVFGAVRSAIEAAFSSSRVGEFLRSLDRQNLRVRHFEQVLERGLLGENVKADYGRLGNGDQGQIREFYLASLEHVAPELRKKYLKLYAYY